LAARLRYASVFVRNSRRLTTIGSSEFLREIHPDLKILLPRQGQRVTNAPASCCRVWAARIKTERGPNVAAVAMANKNARVLWALLSRGDRYRSDSAITHTVLRPGSPSPVERARGAKLLLTQN